VSALDLARLQFGVVTVFHFLIVPTSIGLAFVVAWLQTRHHRTKKELYLSASQFWGKVFLVSFAMGVATGIFQEFQFGMNWSDYSRYVGDVFGAPLAMEGLAAFFIESIFIGLWMFGRGRISPRLHLLSIWMVFVGTMLSAYFILAANSWMQHPVGYKIDPVTDRAEMTSIWAILTNSTQLYAFPHTLLGALVTGGAVVLAISSYHLLRGRHVDVAGSCARLALVMIVVGALTTAFVGDRLGGLLEEQQPMKMAAAEAIYDNKKPADLSVFTAGSVNHDPSENTLNVAIPHGLSLMAEHSWNGEVRGINDVQSEYEQKYGPRDYSPNVTVTYWSFRAMVGAASALIGIGLLGLFLFWRRRFQAAHWFHKLAILGIALPYIANSAGWIFTEMGRQPWSVQGLLLTEDAVSPGTTRGEVLTSLVGFASLYAILGFAAVWIVLRLVKEGPKPPPDVGSGRDDIDANLALTY
jgi:cytochrome d ubiquinol oxidase subunit I